MIITIIFMLISKLTQNRFIFFCSDLMVNEQVLELKALSLTSLVSTNYQHQKIVEAKERGEHPLLQTISTGVGGARKNC